jgi:uncharacterized membrane protein
MRCSEVTVRGGIHLAAEVRSMTRTMTAPDVAHESPEIPAHVGQKIQTTTALFAQAEERAGRHQLAIERATNALGTPATAYALSMLVGIWMTSNALAPRLGLVAPDPPPFQWLQCTVAVAALLMTVTILTSQNRVAKLVQHRAQLDLHVNLIAEEKIAKLIALVEELRRDLPTVKNRRDTLAESMTAAVDVHAVANELEALEKGEGPKGS